MVHYKSHNTGTHLYKKGNRDIYYEEVPSIEKDFWQWELYFYYLWGQGSSLEIQISRELLVSIF